MGGESKERPGQPLWLKHMKCLEREGWVIESRPGGHAYDPPWDATQEGSKFKASLEIFGGEGREMLLAFYSEKF